MEHAPSLNWRLAHRVARIRPDDLPEISANELTMLVADLRVTARRAGAIAARHLGIDAVGATRIRVVDWAGWGHAGHDMADGAIAQLDLAPPEEAFGVRLTAARNGALLGAGMRALSRRLLGQYDAFTGSDTLYLVAPTILAHERRLGFVPKDFRMWVSLHEQTHALQFRLAPWLRDHLMGRMRIVLHDEISMTDGLLGWARTRDLTSLFASPEAGAALAELSSAMTFLEGHADYVSDYAGRRHAPTTPALRRAFARSESATLLGRLSKTFDKNAQYRDGLEFCKKVQRIRNRSALKAAFAEPGNLPTSDEINDPAAWVKRVHG